MKYLKFEREDIQLDDILFSRYKSGGDHMSTMAIQHSYRELNCFLGWVPDDVYFTGPPATFYGSFQHPVNNAGCPGK